MADACDVCGLPQDGTAIGCPTSYVVDDWARDGEH